MDQFEVIATALSIIIGLGMSHLLWTASSAFRSREELRLHWIPLGWAACIFLQHANFLISAFAVDRDIGVWTYSWYLQILLQAVLLFSSGALVLPPESWRTPDLWADFEKHGRYGLLMFAAYQALWIPTNYRADPTMTDRAGLLRPGNLLNFFLIALLLTGFVARRERVQGAAVLLALASLILGMTFAWSQNVI